MAPSLDQQARDRIKGWIATTGVRQADLASRIGRNQAWMSRYLGGELGADLDTLQKIAEVFRHNISALLEMPVDPVEIKLINAFRALPPRSRTNLLNIAVDLSRARTKRRNRK